ncbi:uncharacterized protein DUF4397 [Algoriphagus ratkowskyi]|uniref:DUF4397 domain-containing protein n=1 Tax=Algoriphagus ratkowskyi TaxID=57028 RepID=A0A2W7S2X8_9BACT|nr:DUF4397 domain-containing protein [Algoriphagus ratkowskyi]PZX61309.1 uncharacterized protein DUF4397 [Algoriphagus ratkowskyi]TXD79417.1 DUF4397 domain-containing protein [Algoriphagus ratkowskyi]
MMSVKSFATKNLKSLATVALLAGTIGLTSCMDDNDPIEYPDAGYISIYNGAPSNEGTIVYANQNKVNDFPLNYSKVLPYKNFYPGKRLFKFSEPNSLTSLLEKEFEIKVDSVYSMFIIEVAGALDAILVDDDWSEPTTTEAQLRMVNLSPDAGSVSLKLDKLETPIFSDVAFKSNSEFESIATSIYNLSVVSSKGEILATATNIELKGSRVYTLVVRGYELSTVNSKKLDLQLITNYIDY